MTRAQLLRRARMSPYKLKAREISEDCYEDVFETEEPKKELADIYLGKDDNGWVSELFISDAKDIWDVIRSRS